MAKSDIDTIPDLVSLRTKAARFYAVFLWLHVPVLLYIAARGGVNWLGQLLLLAAILSVPTILAWSRPSAFVTRMSISIALTCMPILLVFNGTGRLQIEYHFYFFVVFAMLVVFCDWRCIIAAATLTAFHHLLFDVIAPARIFPSEGGVTRVALHVVFVVIECGALIWVVAQLRRLFTTIVDEQAIAEAHASVALTDNLTQLGNHRAFHDDFNRELARSRRHHRPLALALIDVDDFKTINDVHGHKRGDNVLMSVSQLLSKLRGEDRSYRLGGDEFAILLVETEPAAVRVALERIRSLAKGALQGVSLSIGYVCLSASQLDEEPYELADTALYEAKRRGRNMVIDFNQIGKHATVFSPKKAAIVRRLIDEEELLSVALQPIWDFASRRPLGFEALARPSAALALAGPAEAFDLAERIRLVPELDRVCFKRSIAACALLPKDSLIFINLSPITLENFSFDPNQLERTIRAAGVLPERVIVEITERSISDPTRLVERARLLGQLGIRIALDHVGAGHAGLDTLSRLNLAFVKIDRSLLAKAVSDRGARGVLAGIIAISRETGTYLIAEGLENEGLLDFARTAHHRNVGAFKGIQGGQGYLLGRPTVGKPDMELLSRWGDVLLKSDQVGGLAKSAS